MRKADKPPPLRSAIVVDKRPAAVKLAATTEGTRYWRDDFPIRGVASEQRREIRRIAQAAFAPAAESALETSRIGCSLEDPASAWARAFNKGGRAPFGIARADRDRQYAELQDVCMQRFGVAAFASVAPVVGIIPLRDPVEPSPGARATLQPPEIGASAISARTVVDASQSDGVPHATT